MAASNTPHSHYTNPVYPHSAPDPFVLKYCGEYWCYSTGLQTDGRAFKILRSPDLVQWREAGSALDLLPGGDPFYWAPEVTYLDGIFYLYYSVGDEEHMHLRVATSESPAGPFVDSGNRLTREKFAIDPHVLLDGGSRYLFYAVDFLEDERIGTGTVMDRMLDPFTLAGQPRPVTRAKYDWQIFDPKRASKGGVRWHTIEGAFVLKHNGRYYQMFSGGNWQNTTYGVGYATADRLDNGEEWEQYCDGVEVLPILRTFPELGVIGPGHNSVVRGPDNRRLYCVYHRWNTESAERVLAIDPLGWDGEQLVIQGPSVTPQEISLPAIDGFDAVFFRTGDCRVEGRLLTLNQVSDSNPEETKAEVYLPGPDFTLEVSLRSEDASQGGEWGLALSGKKGKGVRFSFRSEDGAAGLNIHTGEMELEWFRLSEFHAHAYHLVRLEVEGRELRMSIDDHLLQDSAILRWSMQGAGPYNILSLYARRAKAEFCGLQIS